MIRGTTSGNNNVTFMIHSRNLCSATKKNVRKGNNGLFDNRRNSIGLQGVLVNTV